MPDNDHATSGVKDSATLRGLSPRRVLLRKPALRTA